MAGAAAVDTARPRRAYRSVGAAMDTVVSVEVVTAAPETATRAAIQRALRWFEVVEAVCNRFDPQSELRRLTSRAGEPVAASPILFEAVRFALALARLTGGAFDPTVGGALEALGFDRDYRTGAGTGAGRPAGERVTYRDVRLDPTRRTIALRRPLVLDLGAVAKGLAIDLAARELAAYESICVDAGGDLFARGRTLQGGPWRIGVQDPRAGGELARVLEVDGQAVCTSGDYERRTADGQAHHLIDPRTGRSAGTLASVTVVAPTALAADGLATAAFVLGPERGRRLLEREGVEGMLIDTFGAARLTRGVADAGGANPRCAQR